MARLYNVTQQAWSNWEHGKDTPKPFTMLLIARDAGLNIETLFFGGDDNGGLLPRRSQPTGTDD